MSNKCVHHWLIDWNGTGRCKKCNEVKDFFALQRQRHQFSEHPKKGRPRNKPKAG